MDATNFRYTLAAFAAGALLAVPIVAFVPFPSPPECGYVFDSASVGYVPAACEDAASMADRLDAIRRERPSGRFECAATNGAPLTADECAAYLAERAAITAECGSLVTQEAYEACEAAARAAYRKGR